MTPPLIETQPQAPTPARAAMSFARMLVLAQRRFSASQRPQVPATTQAG